MIAKIRSSRLLSILGIVLYSGVALFGLSRFEGWMAQVDYDGGCKTLAHFKEHVLSKIPGAELVDVPTQYVPQFVRRFNAMPPASNFVGDEIHIVTEEGDSRVTALIFNKGCFVVYQQVGPNVFKFLMGATESY